MGIRSWISRRREGTLLWYREDARNGVLFDQKSGRVAGLFWESGYGMWDLKVCVTFWRAWRLRRSYSAFFWTFAAFPRCWMIVLRMTSAEAAAQVIEEIAEQSGMHFFHLDEFCSRYWTEG